MFLIELKNFQIHILKQLLGNVSKIYFLENNALNKKILFYIFHLFLHIKYLRLFEPVQYRITEIRVYLKKFQYKNFLSLFRVIIRLTLQGANKI